MRAAARLAETCGNLTAKGSLAKPEDVLPRLLRHFRDNAVAWAGKAEDFAGNFFDEIWIGKVRAQEGDIALELGAHGLEALKLELKSTFALKQSFSSLETVAAFQGVMGEVCR